jgi:hypothetical protein
MKVRSDAKVGRVIVELSAREAVAYAQQLIKCAMASGHVEEASRPEPLDTDVMEEREER